jgi:hypothetical protein
MWSISPVPGAGPEGAGAAAGLDATVPGPSGPDLDGYAVGAAGDACAVHPDRHRPRANHPAKKRFPLRHIATW